ncbi:MAG: hypothetical protein EA376_10490 [Phycisphaeraceae bacterium]|nr:MAG: hypothetical protein EA376_10490 [Phycisphaeraceae bacterium]
MFRALSVCSALALSSAVASANFLGVDLRTNAFWNDSATTAIDDGNDYNVVRMFAVFETSSTVNVVGHVTGAEIGGFGVADMGGSFFRAPGTAPTAPNEGLFGVAPALEWNSFITIGLLSVPSDGTIDRTATTDSFQFVDTTMDGERDFVAGDWFNSSPGSNQGVTTFNESTGNYELLLGQFTIRNLPYGFSTTGPASVLENLAFSGELTIFEQEDAGKIAEHGIQFIAIPAPGAIALFGLAGLAGVRRRRA